MKLSIQSVLVMLAVAVQPAQALFSNFIFNVLFGLGPTVYEFELQEDSALITRVEITGNTTDGIREPGDYNTFDDNIFSSTAGAIGANPIGKARGVCTYYNADNARHCEFSFVFTGGEDKLIVVGDANTGFENDLFTIVGGLGKYRGAYGSCFATLIGETFIYQLKFSVPDN